MIRVNQRPKESLSIVSIVYVYRYLFRRRARGDRRRVALRHRLGEDLDDGGDQLNADIYVVLGPACQLPKRMHPLRLSVLRQ